MLLKPENIIRIDFSSGKRSCFGVTHVHTCVLAYTWNLAAFYL